MLYRILRAEMVKANLSVAVLASKIGVTEKTLRNKLNGESDFTWPEAQTIRRLVNPNIGIEELFKKDDSDKKE